MNDLFPCAPLPAAIEGWLLAIVLAAPASAQRLFDGLSTPLPGQPANATAKIAAADVDGDGDLDLVQAARNCSGSGQNRLLRNDGDFVFVDVTATQMPAFVDDSHDVAVVDLDGDSDLDLVFANNGFDRLYLNDGTGTFVNASGLLLGALNDATSSVVAGDIDGDGDVDLVFGTNALERVFVNTPAGFVDETASRIPAASHAVRDLALVDVDGDQDLDLVIAQSRVQIYDNDGAGHFTDATAVRMLPPPTTPAEDVEVADFDHDGDLDLLAVGPVRGQVFFNDGAGHFTGSLPADVPPVIGAYGAAVADFDHDGDRDVAVASYYTPQSAPYGNGGPNRLWFNDGTGRLTDQAARLPFDWDETNCVVAADLDGDGWSDLVFGNGSCARGQQDVLYRNVGGTFVHPTPPRLPVQAFGTVAWELGDLDGDGDVDVVATNGGQPGAYGGIALYFDIDGTFVDGTAGRLPLGLVGYVDLADVDGDADPDLVFASSTSSSDLYVNDGTGRFTAQPRPFSGHDLGAARLADLDGDGDLDLLTIAMTGDVTIWWSQGPGLAGATPTAQPWRLPSPFTLTDMDGDADVDIVTEFGVMLNDGTGTFGGVYFPAIHQRERDVDVGDVDGDGDLDVLFASIERTSSIGLNGGVHLLRNDGTSFTNVTGVRLPGFPEPCYAARFGDVDGDGDLDITMGTGVRFQSSTTILTFANRLLLNDGAGTFTEAVGALPVDTDFTQALAFLDHDDDGDHDLLLGNALGSRLYENLTRHLDTPVPVRLGGRYRVDCHQHLVGASGGSGLALVYVSPTLRRVAVPPLGVLGIAAAQAVHLATIVVPQPDGLGRTDVPVPTNAALVGLPLNAQAVMISPMAPPRFSNVTIRAVEQ